MSTISAKPINHYCFIDALRGSAAILVMLYNLHVETRAEYAETGFSYLLDHLLGGFDLGKFGVVVFFVVSGFLIPTTLDEAPSTKAFVIRRFWRLYPCYWLSIAVAVALAPLGMLRDVPLSPTTVAANLTMAQRYLGQPDVIEVFWTLQVELTFYILCVGLCFFRLFDERRIYVVHVSVLAALALAIVRFVSGKAIPVGLFLALAVMFLADGQRRDDRRVRSAMLFSLVGLAPICFLAYGELALPYILAYIVAWIVFWTAFKHRAWLGFQSPWFKFTGDISYGVYLLHYPVGLTIALHLARLGCPQLVTIMAALLATVAIAWPVFWLIEKPCIRIGRRLSQSAEPDREPSLIPS